MGKPQQFRKYTDKVCSEKDPENKELLTTPTYLDGGIGWAAVFGCFFAHVILGGIQGSVGILYVDILETMDVTKSEVAWVGSLLMGLNCFAAPFVSTLEHVTTYRRIVIFGGILSIIGNMLSYFFTLFPVILVGFGLLQGIGHAMILVASIMAVNSYFEKKRPLAIAVGISGAGIGMTLFPILEEILLVNYGINGTFLINAAIHLNTFVCGGLYFPLKREKIRNERTSLVYILKALCNFSVIMNPRFILFLFVNILGMMGSYVFGSFFPQYMVFRGYSMREASAAISFNGISSSIGRVFAGYLCCKFYSYRPLLYAVFLGGCGVSLFTVTISESYIAFIGISAIYGVTSGGIILVQSVIVADLFGREVLSSSLGMMYLAQGIGLFAGNPIAGAISDGLDDENIVFYFGGILLCISVILMLPIICSISQKPRDYTNQSIVILIDENETSSFPNFFLDIDSNHDAMNVDMMFAHGAA